MKKSKKKHKTEVVGRDGELILVDTDKTTLWGRLKDKLGMALLSAGAVVAAITLSLRDKVIAGARVRLFFFY